MGRAVGIGGVDGDDPVVFNMKPRDAPAEADFAAFICN